MRRPLKFLAMWLIVALVGTSGALATPAFAAAGPATHFSVGAPAAVAGGSAFTFTVVALDANGNTATGYTGTVHFSSSDASATLPSDATLSSGQGTFTATLRTFGTQTVAATDTASSAITGSDSLTVTAHLILSAPSSVGSGSAFTFTVTAADSWGNILTGYGGTVHFTSSDGSATLPADSTLRKGQGTFLATLRSLYSQTLTATDTTSSTVTGSDAVWVVTSGGATHFAVDAPSTATPGTGLSFTVTALTSANQIATGYTGLVSFASSDGYATLPASSSLTAGRANFSAVMRTPGYQTITAADAVLGLNGTSTPIAVGAAGTATHFNVDGPTSVTAGVPFALKVTALDAFGNTATGYGGVVRFTSTDASATLPANSTLRNGTATFTVALRTVASQIVTAIDTANSGIDGTSNLIQVTAVPPPPCQQAAGTTNPSTNQLFVCHVYPDLLGRQVDAAGLEYWTGALASGVSRAAVAAAIMTSTEYRIAVVTRAYGNLLSRGPDPAGLYLFTNLLGQGLRDESMEAAIIGSSEYFAVHGGTVATWLSATYDDLLGRLPDPAGNGFWQTQAAAGMSRTQIAAAIAASNEYRALIVTALYRALLSRSPASAEVSYWAAIMGGGATDEQVIALFLGSPEYLTHTLTFS